MKALPACRHLAVLLGLLFAVPAARAEPFAFGVFGDTPYGHWEREHLPLMLEEMGREPLAFAIHDGDIKSGGGECSDDVFRDILGVFDVSAHPLIYVPGDNDWTDCHRISSGRYDPLERLKRLRELFFAGAESLGRQRIPLRRQSADPKFPAYRENAAWERNGIGFVTLNVPGSRNGIVDTRNPSAEFIERGAANRAWLAAAFQRARSTRLAGLVIVIQANPDFATPLAGYGEFVAQVREETLAYSGQVLLVHGDTHRQRIDQPLTTLGGAPITNFTRLETFGSPLLGWVKVTADSADPHVFRFSPRIWRPPQ